MRWIVSSKCKRIMIAMGIGIIVCMTCLFLFFIYYYGIIQAYFSLDGNDKIALTLNEEYKEEGFRAFYHMKNYEDKISITTNLDTSKIGKYIITYRIDELDIERTRNIEVKDTLKPTIKLIGKKQIMTFIDNEYEEEGVLAIDNYDGDITSKVVVKSDLDITKEGKYFIQYRVKDSSGNTQKMVRKVIVKKDPMNTKLKYNYDEYDNSMIAWWFHKSKEHKREEGPITSKELKKYDSYYIGEDDKVIYLTLDEGGSNITYIKEISAILNKYDIKATYFLTRNYILKEEEFINKLVDAGHIIGNHSRNHLDMTTLANASKVDEYVEEITSVEKAYMKVTGEEMIKLFRFPKGEGSLRGMKMLQDLGYRNYFWSHAYYDFGAPLSFKEAYDSMINYYHPGAIYLIHPNNKGNYLAIESFVKEMLDKGYRFDTVDHIK